MEETTAQGTCRPSASACGLRLRIPAEAAGAGIARQAVAGVAEDAAIDPAVAVDIKRVVSEACTNAALHAYRDTVPGEVEVEATADGEGFDVVVRDFGTGFQPRADDGRDPLRLGLGLIGAVSDRFQIRSEAGRGTEVAARIACRSRPAEHALEPVLARTFSSLLAGAGRTVDELAGAGSLARAMASVLDPVIAGNRLELEVPEVAAPGAVGIGPVPVGRARELLGDLDRFVSELADPRTCGDMRVRGSGDRGRIEVALS